MSWTIRLSKPEGFLGTARPLFCWPVPGKTEVTAQKRGRYGQQGYRRRGNDNKLRACVAWPSSKGTIIRLSDKGPQSKYVLVLMTQGRMILVG